MAVSKPDFTRQFGSAKVDLTPISSSNYVQGWDFVGSTPPTKNDFTYLQNLADQRSIWLFENYGSGRLLNVQRLLATGTYTPTPGTKRLIVEMIGGGAGSGGVPASSQTSNFASGGGGAGAYIRFLLDNPPETVPVTVGAAGQPGGGTGLPGGLSQFGNYALVNGGQGASFGQAANDKLLVNGGMGGSVGATSGVVVINAQNGQKGGTAVMLSGGNGSLNDGANSPLGTGGAGSGNGAGLTGSGFGSGGGGSMTVVQATGVGYSGAPGRPGIIIIWEYA